MGGGLAKNTSIALIDLFMKKTSYLTKEHKNKSRQLILVEKKLMFVSRKCKE